MYSSHFFIFLVLFAALARALPSPLTSEASSSLYGTDCSEWCLNGSVVLQPDSFGDTNQYCSDARGCYWLWRMRIVPCSMSLLSFDAEVGTAGTLYSTIDPADHATLGFYCSESGSGSSLELRSHNALAPLMQWRYQMTTCAALLGNLAARLAPFSGSDTIVELSEQTWFGSQAERLENLEVDCDAPEQRAVLAPCEQCFAGTQLAPLPQNTSDTLAVACGFAPGEITVGPPKMCPVRWHFCYDACGDVASSVAVRLGSGTPLKSVNAAAARKLSVQAGEPDNRGRTVYALTDAPSVQALDAGAATFFLLWEYREAPQDELFRTSGRDALFVALHFAMETDGGEQLSALKQYGSDIHSLGTYAWDGAAPTGIDAVVAQAKSLSSREAGLVAGIVLIGVALLASIGLNLYLLWMAWSQHRPLIADIGDSVYQYSEERAAPPVPTTPYEKKQAELALQRRGAQVAIERWKSDTSHLTMTDEEGAIYRAQLKRDKEDAERFLQDDYDKNGGALGSAAQRLPVISAVVNSYRAGQDELRREQMSVPLITTTSPE